MVEAGFFEDSAVFPSGDIGLLLPGLNILSMDLSFPERTGFPGCFELKWFLRFWKVDNVTPHSAHVIALLDNDCDAMVLKRRETKFHD